MRPFDTSPELPDRFELVRELGRGGMGVVYQVVDRTRGEHVALKTLREPSPEAIFRLKREFRALAELRHPGLLRLHELFVESATCFFTMDLVDGVDLLSYVARRRTPLSHADTLRKPDTDDALASDDREPELALTPRADPAVLRGLLLQLADVLDFLHATGRVHRDLKPSNILVTTSGRLVLLDFGLVKETSRIMDSSRDGIVGTAVYMAPEQSQEADIDAAADWYAVGCIVYQALVGRLPFDGAVAKVLLDKLKSDPVPPRSLVPTADADLSELAMELLSRDPAARPGADEVRRRLGRSPVESAVAQDSPSWHSGSASIVGREAELAALRDALARVYAGRRQVVTVFGSSGIGKSSLVRAFLREAQLEHDDLVVLQGRCLERESVSYQAVDGLIDDLSSFWRHLPDAEAAALLPREASLLARLFPVLGRVRAVTSSRPVRAIADPSDLRSRGLAALRSVLQRIADRRPLVIVLDDMQWADPNTLDLLADVMSPSDAPDVLLVLSSRSSGRAALDKWLRRLELDVQTIDLTPLTPAVCEAFAAERLGHNQALAAAVARECGGVPIFLQELVQHAVVRADAPVQGISLDDIMRDRISTLASSQRWILNELAVASEPTSRAVLSAATGNSQQQLHRDLSSLAADRLVRAAGRRATDTVELYHDRVREVVLHTLDPEQRRELHRALAIALVEAQEDKAHALARHWLAAGEPRRAADHARLGAAHANARLDFNTAAELYALAIEHGEWEPQEHRELWFELGTARSRAGLSLEAADAFANAAEIDSGLVALDMRRRAAEELLRGGYLDEGLEAIRKVLATTGTGLAKTPRRAFFSLLGRRAWLRIRGLRWRQARPGADSPELLTRIDVYNTVAMGLAIVDAIRGADFQCRSLLASLRSGDAERLARALAVESAYLSAQGASRRARLVGERARKLANEVGGRLASAHVAWGVDAFYAYYVANNWPDAVQHFEDSERLFRTGVLDAGWEIDTVRLYACFAHLYLGDLRELSALVPTYVREAERRGDRYWAVSLRTRLYIVWLVKDDVAQAVRDVDDAIASWAPWEDGYQVQHFFAVHGRCELALYQSDPEAAAEHLYRGLPGLRRSLLLHVTMVGLEVLQLEARIAAARAAATPETERRKHLRTLDRLVGKLVRHPRPLGRALAPLLAAAAAHLKGDDEAAARHLRDGIAALEASHTMLHANAAKLRLSALLDGAEAAALRAEATSYFDANDVANPERLTDMLIPGW